MLVGGATVLEWIQSFGADIKSILVAIKIVAGAVVGAVIKGIFDRRLQKRLEKLVDDAQAERKAAFQERGDALREREAALGQLHEREAESREKRRNWKSSRRSSRTARSVLRVREDQSWTSCSRHFAETRPRMWTSHGKVLPFRDYNERIDRRRPVIIVVANNKGEVGKTTVTGNLLAYFDRELHKRVLVIDLDYQGSVSTMLRSEQGDTVKEMPLLRQ